MLSQPPVQQVDEGKSAPIIMMRSAMTDGRFDEAKQIERDNLLAMHVVASVANSVYETLSIKHDYQRAIELSKRYDLGDDKVNEAAIAHFRLTVARGQIEEALTWGLKWKLSNLEISRAAVKGIEQSLMTGDIPKAVDLRTRYNITLEQIGNSWMKGYDLAMEQRRFFDAALLSRDFGQSERKTLLTAAKALKEALQHDRVAEAVRVEQEFQFFNDQSFGLIGDEESKAVVEVYQDFILNRMTQRDAANLLKFVDGSRLLYGLYKNSFLNNLVQFVYKKAVDFHGMLLDDNMQPQAKDIKEQLGLMEDRVSVELRRRMMEQALKYHNRILLDNKYDQAKAIKDEYELLGLQSPSDVISKAHEAAQIYFSQRIAQGELKKAKFILEEYGLPRTELTTRLLDDLKKLLDDGKYKIAFDMVLEFKVPIEDSDLREAAQRGFEDCLEQGYYEIAADLGHVFEIKHPKLREAATIIWQRAMETEDYKKARTIKRKHKLGRKETGKIATQAYHSNMERNKADIARKIREEYHINLGFMEMLMEFLKTIFSFLFKS